MNKYLASLNIKSLYTNKPLDRYIERLHNHLQKSNTTLPLPIYKLIKIRKGGCPRSLTVKAMDCGIVVREFVLQSHYYVHFRANTLGKGMNTLILQAIG